MKYYCDTNFIIRYLLGDNEEMSAKTIEYFNLAQSGEITLIIEQTVFTETIFVLSSFYKVPKDKISKVLSDLLSYKGIYSGDIENLLTALELFAKKNLHIVDCILIAKSNTSSHPVLSFDKELNEILNKNSAY